MAKGNAKRVAAANAQTIKQLRLGFAISGAIYLLHLFIFRSGRTWRRAFLFSFTEIIAVVLWQQLEGMAKRTDELAAPGLTSYIFDVIYVTWFVHVATALISTKFWYLYLVIPSYAIYRLVKFALPYVWPSAASPSTAGQVPNAPHAAATPAAETETLSKRQAKIKAREEKGGVRMSYR
ncbi:hypothetical protein BCR35DRAFT_284110 [Leucosporidium creatinivorum]|uniref:DUF788-domain-containing protein n=1 Tax=Leucosporidium creatinivorum TaxID=106004 RepID=A0A1Y2DB97_9BASI|nr:hypothetical protein BCR35DRAFT_284110 [Leucosporidium creatinivorum]